MGQATNLRRETSSSEATLTAIRSLQTRTERLEQANARSLTRLEALLVALQQPGTPLPEAETETDFPLRIPIWGHPGISVVSCAMNRTGNLLRALPSWLAQPAVSEVVIVDWSSREPVLAALEAAGIADPRIRVIRIEGAPRWILSQAFNAGFRAAQHDTILKLDADIVLSEDFLTRNPLPGTTAFTAGNWRNAAKGQEHVNGFFLVGRAGLAQVGGFNEFITTYGWDDDDIYARLEAAGLERRDVAPETVYHLPHDDEARTGTATGTAEQRSARAAVMATPRFMIQRNRKLVERLPGWSSDFDCLPLEVTGATPKLLTLKIAGPHPHQVPRALFDETGRQMLQELMSWDFGAHVRDLPATTFERIMDLPLDRLDRDLFRRALSGELPPPPEAQPDAASMPSPLLAPARDRLFIDAQHGLGNRLRAIGSAAAIANATGRELVIVWQPDDHCDCRFADLFHHDGAVIDRSFHMEAGQATVYNYMPTESDAKGALIAADRPGDIYARSAFVLNSPHSDWTSENRFLQQLVPVEAVQDLVASVRNPNDVSAHVRMEAGPGLDHNSYDRPENWRPEDHALIHEWRTKSHFSHFMARLDALAAEGRARTIFLAADLPGTYDAFADRYGERLAWLPRNLYDRSAEQLHYALADAILLSRAPRMLGSTWSSFSELAMRLAPGEVTVEMSGRNF